MFNGKTVLNWERKRIADGDNFFVFESLCLDSFSFCLVAAPFPVSVKYMSINPSGLIITAESFGLLYRINSIWFCVPTKNASSEGEIKRSVIRFSYFNLTRYDSFFRIEGIKYKADPFY